MKNETVNRTGVITTSADVSVNAQAVRDNTRIFCLVEDLVTGESYSSQGAAVEFAPLTIKTHPKSIAANKGDLLTFTIEAIGGSGSYKYQWEYKSANANVGEYYTSFNIIDDYISGATANTLKVYADKNMKNFFIKGKFRCKVTDTVTGVSIISSEAYVSPKS